MHFRSACVLLSLAAVVTAQAAVEPAAAGPTPLTFAEANRRAALPRWLSLKFAEFDTAGPAPAIPAELQGTPVGRDWFLVQLADVPGPATDAALRARGVEPFDHVPNRAWIVRATPEQVAASVRDGVAVWSSPLHPAYRVEPELLLATTERRVAVIGFRGIDAATLRAQAVAAGAAVLEQHEQIGRWLLLATATPAVVRALARCRDVQWVEPESVVTDRNDTMTWAVQTGASNNRRLWTLGLRGEGQIVGHMDGAIAQGSCFFADPLNPVGPSHRKLVYVSGTGTSNGHGTHTAGTVAGDPFPVNASTTARGLAYAARLAHSNNYSASSWATRANEHRTAGARLHTNSWGNDGTTAYNAHCVAIDAFSWTNEDHLVLFAETNLSTLKNPENAKNLVAVGNARNGANYDQKGGGGVGPTADGRRKPDLFAPGTSIVSASTSSCATTSMTGTSMACPAATAAGALVRQYFTEGFYPSGVANAADAFVPTGALVKAVLVNTCVDMAGVAGYPNDTEGWGRVVLDESLHFGGDAGRLWVADVRRANGLVTSALREYTVDVASSSRPLEITLAFTDFAGTLNAANPVVDDLDLVVVAPGGAVQYLGNVWANGWSATGGVADAKNNVERVALQLPGPGTWTLRVVGTSVPQGPCGYALCVTGDLAGPFALASLADYGTGKPGLHGVPTLSGTLPILPSTWTLSVGATMPSQFGIVVFGGAPAAIPFDGGTVLVDPVILTVFLADANGAHQLPVVLPASTALAGSSTWWQAWMPNDPGAAGDGWSASRGLRMTMGH
jgi:hypothetical protein